MSWTYNEDDPAEIDRKARAEATKAAFLVELKALLTRYHAEIEAEDHYRGYPECGEDVRMTVLFDGHPEFGYAELDLGRYIEPNKSTEPQ